MKIEDLIEGLTIIARTQPETEVTTYPSHIVVGRYKPERMTQKERLRLAALNWRLDNSLWTIFV